MARKKKEEVKESKEMNPEELLKAVDLLEKEKGISPDVIFSALELALTSAYKKNYGLPNARVDINHDTGEIKVYAFKTVVRDPDEYGCINYDEVEKYYDEHQDELDNDDFVDMPEIMFDPNIHLTLDEAQKLVPGIKIGETIEKEVTPKDFGRVAAATAKQVVVQKIREAEREVIINEFTDKQDELVSGIVAMEDEKNYFIDLGRTQGILPKTEIIPGEKIVMGSSIKVYITKVDNNGKGPLILLSRTHYGFVKRLFELEIPEINEGIILVHSVAREAGVRTKIAVESTNSRVDAVGACIGEHGSRIANILKELGGEKIDVIPYDTEQTKFIENALSPAKNVTVIITNEENNEATAIVDQDNLSLAIGKKGLNVRLAARLTHFKIDVKTYEQAKEDGINIIVGD
jgi:N utilization substance protein A